jgi:hypothetical protein
MKFVATLSMVFAAGLIVSGCSSDGDAEMKAQIAAAKKMPPPTSAQLQKGFAAMAESRDRVKQEEVQWMKDHPDKVAAVNASRAKHGTPPLGQ